MGRVAINKRMTRIGLPAIFGLVGLIVAAGSVVAYYQFTQDHLPPNISINSIDVGTLSYEEALSHLSSNSPSPAEHQVVVSVDGINVASSSSELGLSYRHQELLTELQRTATQGRLRDQLYWRIKPLFSPQSYQAKQLYDDVLLSELLDQLNQHVQYPGQAPSVTLQISGNENSIEVFPGKRGRAIDTDATKSLIQEYGPTASAPLSAVVASTAAELTDDEVQNLTARAGKYVDKSIEMYFENSSFYISDKELVSFLDIPTGFNTSAIETKVATIAAQVNRAPQEPIFEYNQENLQVTKFLPPLNGQSLDSATTKTQILDALARLEQSTTITQAESESTKQPRLQLAVATTPPATSLGETNSLGISERIGFGDSHYDHSIPNRIHNVALTTQRINNVIVPPGAEFSFNKVLGEVSAATGFRSAYVIKNGQTALGDGGGVCQVSTTLFRSVLDAGLKVTRRLPHSYRVSYYELDRKPGVDATVYSGETDFRFVNDTGQHLLVHGVADSKNLYMYMEIYGTSDGRTTEIKDHITWNPRPAPAPQYFPDPSLPEGKLVQIDWAASGISSSFVNVIRDKNGAVIREDKYVSVYRPWAAKYRQGVTQ